MTSIAAERANLAAVGLTLRQRERWDARFDYTNSRPVDEPADHVFCHISVTNPGSYNGNDAHIRAIENIGISRFGNTGFSYNRAITQDGTAYEGQPIGRRGAHTLNDKKLPSCITSGCPGLGAGLYAPSYNLNVNARAYVIAQNVDDSVSDRQLDAVARCIAADILAGHVKRSARIHGHRCVAWKDCPGGRMWARMGELEKRVNAYVRARTVGTPLEDDMPSPKDWTDEDWDAVRDHGHGWWATNPETGKKYGWLARRTWEVGGEFIQGHDGELSPHRALELLYQWLSGPDQVQNPHNDEKSSVRHALGRMWHHIYNNIFRDARASRAMLEAYEPLLEAAAEGRSLSAEQVASIASKVSTAVQAAVPAELAENVADELGERISRADAVAARGADAGEGEDAA